MWWATDVGIAFERVEEGFETALKDYNKKQVVLNSKKYILRPFFKEMVVLVSDCI